MTNEEINRAVAESVGFNWWAVEKGGWYYRQGGAGYTNRIEEAGRYTEADARKELVRGEPMGVHRIPHPDYCNSYDAIMPLVKALKNGMENHFADKLVEAVLMRRPSHRDLYVPISCTHALITATPRQLCEAYLAVGGADA
jgi:hypothetical protein